MLLMSGMIAWSLDALPLVERPATRPLVVAVIATAVAWALELWAERSTESPRVDPVGDRRPEPGPGGSEPPAVVALITNGFRVPSSAITATALDLAARGWVRLAVVDDELAVVANGQGAAGDSLRSYEQQVLNHLSSRAFNGMVSAGTLAVSQHRLDRRWRNRFGAAVVEHARVLGLCRRRYDLVQTVPPIVAGSVALIAWVYAVTRGTDVALEVSWRPRAIALAVLAALVLLVRDLVVRITGNDQVATEGGRARTAVWLGYRRRLRARIPDTATVLAAPQQQAALAVACVMGVAEQVHEQVPIAGEDARWAWSEAGPEARVVRVRYPIRPGYGQHPLRVAGAGIVVLLVARWVQGFLRRVADGDALDSLLDKVPGQIGLIEGLASFLAVLCWLPIVWAGWSVLAGAVDLVATRERIGLVVRTRRPADVVPFAHSLRPFSDRDRFSTYLAVDDGSRRSVGAWLASERTAAPQGAQARVRATPMLGFVRSSEPVGTAASRV
jgi:Predicted membrane protein (DUF2207)